MNKPFFSLKRKELQAICSAALSLLESASTFSNSHGYVFVTRSQNPALFNLLDYLQFFEFQVTNKKRHICGVHQIVIYLTRGAFRWRYNSYKIEAIRKNQRLTEVHHLDSNPSNNSPDNLVYVTPQQNSICSNVVNKPYHGLRSLNSANIHHWDKLGNGLSDTAKLVRLTLVRTLKAAGFSLSQLPSVANILLQLPANLGKHIVKYWQFSWLHNLPKL